MFVFFARLFRLLKSQILVVRDTNFLRKPLSQHSNVQYNTTLRHRLNLTTDRNILLLLNAVINNSVLLFMCLKSSILSHKWLPVEQDEVTYYYLLFQFTAPLSITIHFHLQITCRYWNEVFDNVKNIDKCARFGGGWHLVAFWSFSCVSVINKCLCWD